MKVAVIGAGGHVGFPFACYYYVSDLVCYLAYYFNSFNLLLNVFK